MKKYLGFLIVGILALGAMQVGAENSGPSSTDREDWKQEMKAKRDAFREQLREKRDNFKEELRDIKEAFKNANPERKRDFWNKSKRMVGERFEAAVKNMERAQSRIAELIEKMKTAGKDTTEAEDSLDSSKEKLAEAKTKIAEIKALIPANGEKITPEVFEQIKVKAREAKDLLKEAHNDLKEALKILKQLARPADDDDAEDDSQ